MSFPTKAGTSPSLQRDYALLGNRPSQRKGTPRLDGFEEESEISRESEATASMDEQENATTQQGSAISVTDEDGMSNLSLPHDDDDDEHEEVVDHESASASGRPASSSSKRIPTSRPTSLHHTSPYMGPSSYGDYSRGNRMANLHQQFSTAPVQVRRSSGQAAGHEHAGTSLGGIIPSSYVLGGHHMMPPADADMRSQAELDALSHSSIDAFLPHDDDLTPRPDVQPGSPYGSLRARNNVANQASSSERRPLLSHDGDGGSSTHEGHVKVVSYTEPSDPTQSTRQRRASSLLHSGWDSRQPAPPDQAQIDAMARETEVNPHRREIAVLTRFAIPIWLTHLLELSLNVVSVFSLGHIGTNELAAASLSSMTANVTGFSVLAGFISALDSILPSAYTSQPKMVGLYTQRMLVIVGVMLFPIVTCWLCAEYILLALGQEPTVASLAAQYLRILVIGLPAYAGFEVCRRYLQAQNLMHAPTIVLLVASPVNAVLTWLFVWGPKPVRFGFIGAPMASAISMWLMFVLGATQCYLAPRVAWDGWSRRAFTGLRPIVQLGVGGMFAMCAEWWSWEIVGLVTSKLGTITLAAQSVLLVCSSISYQLPYAISVAAAVRVGNLLGALQPKQANVASNMALVLSLFAGAANSTVFLLLRNKLGTLFSEDQQVIDLITLVIPVMAFFQVMDGLTGVAGGILRGTGRQSAGAIINLTGYYVIGIPFGLLLTFGPPKMGLSGLWIGLTVALSYASIFIYLMIKRTNWNVEVAKTIARMNSDQSGIKVPVVGLEDEDITSTQA